MKIMRTFAIVAGAGFAALYGMGLAGAQTQEFAADPSVAQGSAVQTGRFDDAGWSADMEPDAWKTNGAAGFIGSSPDGTALAMNGSADYFLSPELSVGPLLQFGFTGDMTLVGLSGQAKYWLGLPGTQGRGKIAAQSGLGFAHADFRGNDTSWLIPLGIGYEHALDSGVSLTGTALVNFTNLHTGAGTGADVMPGFVFGVRF